MKALKKDSSPKQSDAGALGDSKGVPYESIPAVPADTDLFDQCAANTERDTFSVTLGTLNDTMLSRIVSSHHFALAEFSSSGGHSNIGALLGEEFASFLGTYITKQSHIVDLLDKLDTPPQHRNFVLWVLLLSYANAHMSEQQFREVIGRGLVQEFVSGTPPFKPGSPMPSNRELKDAGKLFSQRPKQDPQTDIINHLREHWMPWIEADVLTQKELYARDQLAGKALSTWRNKGNSVKETLGHDIPRRQDITQSNIAAAVLLPPGDRSEKVAAAMRYHAKKAKAR